MSKFKVILPLFALIAVFTGVYLTYQLGDSESISSSDTSRKGDNKVPIVPVPDKEHSYDKISSENIYKKKLSVEKELIARANLCKNASDKFFSENNNSLIENVDIRILNNRIQYIFKNTLHSSGEAKLLKYFDKLLERKSNLIEPDQVFEDLQKYEVCRDSRSIDYLSNILSSLKNIRGDEKQKKELKGLFLYSLKRILGYDFRGLNLRFITENLMEMANASLLDESSKKGIESIEGKINDELIIFKEQYNQEVTNLKKMELLSRHLEINKNIRNQLEILITKELDKTESQLGMN